MQHSFNVELAKEYGILEAVLLNHLWFWIKKNKANNDNYFDGNYWTYNSKKAFSELFPYASERQIDYALKKLIDCGLVITGNYNKSSYDRTLWYAITKVGYSILQNCEMETTKLLNGNDKIVQPIPDINTDINTNIEEKENNNKLLFSKKEEKNQKYEELVNKLIEVYNSYDVFPKVIAVTKKRKQKINSRLKDVGYDRLIDAFALASKSDFLTGKNDNNWKADFDWFVENDTNCIKVLENKYGNKQARTIYETI